MSWDVFIQDLPPDARSVKDIPDEFHPRSLGRRDDVVSRIRSAFPDADFSDPTWGRLQKEGYWVDISVGDNEDVTGVTLHVRGADEAVGAVVSLIDAIGGRGVDSWTGELFDQAIALHSIRRWRAYLEEI
ncbi:MAG: hypothetical protein ACXW2P_04440 [Thermoanaerobaculia bacterium]